MSIYLETLYCKEVFSKFNRRREYPGWKNFQKLISVVGRLLGTKEYIAIFLSGKLSYGS